MGCFLQFQSRLLRGNPRYTTLVALFKQITQKYLKKKTIFEVVLALATKSIDNNDYICNSGNMLAPESRPDFPFSRGNGFSLPQIT